MVEKVILLLLKFLSTFGFICSSHHSKNAIRTGLLVRLFLEKRKRERYWRQFNIGKYYNIPRNWFMYSYKLYKSMLFSKIL